MHSNRYTFTFTIVITIIASTLLALASTVLEERQDYNIDVDKKKNILKCVGINVDEMSSEMIVEEYSRNIENLIIAENLNKRFTFNLFKAVSIEVDLCQ